LRISFGGGEKHAHVQAEIGGKNIKYDGPPLGIALDVHQLSRICVIPDLNVLVLMKEEDAKAQGCIESVAIG
jgi:hypothetical protein